MNEMRDGGSSNDQLIMVIEVLKRIQKSDLVSQSEVFYEDFEKIIERLENKTFRLAVVGEFSSGKSTFLNALIGMDLLKHGTQETTATVTEIYNDSRYTDEPVFDVYYSNGNIKKEIPLMDITDFTTTTSAKHSVASEIEKVVIRSKIIDINENICFVDTPGLNGIADNHREKTIEQIKSAHACVYLMQVRGLGNSDIEFIKYISKYQKNIIFIQNFIDELRELEGETPDEKVREQNKIIESILGKDPSIKYKLIAVSARNALIARAKEFIMYNQEYLTEEMRKQLWINSRFEEVIATIDRLIVENQREKEQQRIAVEIAISLLSQLESIINYRKEEVIKDWDESTEGKVRKNYEKTLIFLKDHRFLYKDKLDNFVETQTVNIQKNLIDYIPYRLEQIVNSVDQFLSEIAEVDNMEYFTVNALPVYLHKNISEIENKMNMEIRNEFEYLICNAVLKIQEFTSNYLVQEMKHEFNVAEIMSIEVQNFSPEEDELKKAANKVSFNKQELKETQRLILENEVKIKQINADLEKIYKNYKELQNEEKIKIEKLGEIPEEEIVMIDQVYSETRPSFGRILDYVVGEKKKIRRVPYFDNTEQRKWIEKKNKIEHEYNTKRELLENQRKILESKRESCMDEVEEMKRDMDLLQKNIKRKEQFIKIQVEYLKIQKENAKREYLSKMKQDVRNRVRKYLKDNVQSQLTDNCRETITKNKIQATKMIMGIFDISFDQRIHNLENMLGKEKNIKYPIDYDKESAMIKEGIGRLEEFLCC